MADNNVGGVNLDLTADAGDFRTELNSSAQTVVRFVEAAAGRFEWLAQTMTGLIDGPIAGAFGNFAAEGRTFEQTIRSLNAQLGIVGLTASEVRVSMEAIASTVTEAGGAMTEAALSAAGLDQRVVGVMRSMNLLRSSTDQTAGAFVALDAEMEITDELIDEVVSSIKREDDALLKLAGTVQGHLRQQEVASARNVQITVDAEEQRVRARQSAEARSLEATKISDAQRIASEEKTTAKIIQLEALADETRVRRGIKGDLGTEISLRRNNISGYQSQIKGASTDDAERLRAAMSSEQLALEEARVNQMSLDRQSQSRSRYLREIVGMEDRAQAEIDAIVATAAANEERIVTERLLRIQKLRQENATAIERITRESEARNAEINAKAATANEMGRKAAMSEILTNTAIANRQIETLAVQLQQTLNTIADEGVIDELKRREVVAARIEAINNNVKKTVTSSEERFQLELGEIDNLAEAEREVAFRNHQQRLNNISAEAAAERLRLEEVVNARIDAINTGGNTAIDRRKAMSNANAAATTAQGNIAGLRQNLSGAGIQERSVINQRISAETLALQEAQLEGRILAEKIKAETSFAHEQQRIRANSANLSANQVGQILTTAEARFNAEILEIDRNRNAEQEALANAHATRLVGIEERRIREMNELNARNATPSLFGSGPIVDAFSPLSKFARQFSMAREAANTMMTAGGMGALPVIGSVMASSDITNNLFKARGNTEMSDADFAAMKNMVMNQPTNQGADKQSRAFMEAEVFDFHGKKASQIVEAATPAAISTFTDLDKVTEALAHIMHIFNIQVSEAPKVLNAMEIAAARSNMTFEEFVSKMGRAFQTTAAMGIPLTESAAILSTFAKNGMTASQSATALRSIVTGLVNPSKDSQKWIKHLSDTTGVDLVKAFSAAGVAHYGLTGIMGMLSKATGNNVDLLKHLFADQRNFIPVIELLTHAHKDMSATLADETTQIALNNRVQNNAAAVQATFSYQMAALWQNVIRLAAGFGDALAPQVKAVSEWLNGLVNHFKALDPGTKAVIADTVALGSAFLLFGGGILAVVARLPQLLEGFTVLKGIFGLTTVAAAGTEAAAAGAASAGAAAGAGISGAFLPIAALVVLVATAIKAFKTAWEQDWGHIREYAAGVAGTLKNIFSIVQQTITDVTKALNDNFASMGPEAQTAFEFVLKVVKSVLDSVLLVIITVLGAAKQVVIGFVETVSGVIKLIVRIVGNVIQLVTDLINFKWADAWKDAKKLVSDAIDDIGHTILGLWDGIAGGIGSMLNTFATFGQSIGDSIKNGFFAADVDGAIKKALDDAAASARNAQETIKPIDPMDPKLFGVNHSPSNWKDSQKIGMYDEQFKTVSSRTGVPVEILKTLMHMESGGGIEGRTLQSPNPGFKDKDGKWHAPTVDYGLMQINSGTVDPKSYDWQNPYENIMKGALIFKQKQAAADKNGEGLPGAFRRYNGEGERAEKYSKRAMDYLKSTSGSWQFSFGPIPGEEAKLPTKPKKTTASPPHPKDQAFDPLNRQTGMPEDIYAPSDPNVTDEMARKWTVSATNYKRILEAIDNLDSERLAKLGDEATAIDRVTVQLETAMKKADLYHKAAQAIAPDSVVMAKYKELQQQVALRDKLGDDVDANRKELVVKQDIRDKVFSKTNHTGRTDQENKDRALADENLFELETKNTHLNNIYEAQVSKVARLTQAYHKHFEESVRLTSQYNSEERAIAALQAQKSRLESAGPAGDLRYVQSNMKAGLYTHQQYQDRLKGMLTGIAVRGGMQQEDVEGKDPTAILERLKTGTDQMRAAVKDYENVLNVLSADVILTSKATEAAVKANKEAFNSNMRNAVDAAQNDLKSGAITFQDFSDIMDFGMRKVATAALGATAVAGKSMSELKTMMVGADASLTKEFESMYAAFNTQSAKHDAAVKKASDSYLKTWRTVAKGAADSMASEIDKVLHKHESIAQAIRNIWRKIFDDIIKQKIEGVARGWADKLAGVFDHKKDKDTIPGADVKVKTIEESMKDLQDVDVLNTKAQIDLTTGIKENTNALSVVVNSMNALSDAFISMMTSGTGGYDNVGQWQDPGTTTTGNTATGDNSNSTTSNDKKSDSTKSNDKSAADVQSAAHAVSNVASANASTVSKIASLGDSVAQISRDPGIGKDVNLVTTLAKPGGPTINDAPALASDVGLGAAVPWIAAAVAVVGLISALGAQKKPDYETRIGKTQYGTLMGTDFTAMANSGPEGPDGARALLGNYAAIRNQKAGNTVHHVEIQPNAIMVTIQGVDPSNAKQVAGMVAGHVQDIIDKNNTVDHATRGTF